MEEEKISWTWYLLPIFFSLLGGIVGYYLIRKKNDKIARNLILIGLVIFFAQMIIFTLSS